MSILNRIFKSLTSSIPKVKLSLNKSIEKVDMYRLLESVYTILELVTKLNLSQKAVYMQHIT